MKRLAFILAGFLALILGFLPISFLAAPFFAFYTDRNPNESATQVLTASIKTACSGYRQEYGHLPKALSNREWKELLSGNNPRGIAFLDVPEKFLNPNREIVDAWGTPLRFIEQPHQTIMIVSAGKDRKFGTGDDIKASAFKVVFTNSK